MKNPNPQGQALVPLIEAWQSTQPSVLRASTPRKLINNCIIGMLVLSARYQFLPVPGRHYHLYWREDEWQLSMISPTEWGERLTSEYVGQCTLNPDRTWTLIPTPAGTFSAGLLAALECFREGFVELLDTDQPLAEGLPYYIAALPYYPRLLACGLAKSLDYSIVQLGAQHRSGRNWLVAAPLPALAAPAQSY